MTAAAVPAPRSWDLVERAQAGDSEAMAEIYRANYDRVFAFIYFRTGNRQVAEDLTEDVFERMLRRLHTVQWQGRDIGAWLTTIARNLIADRFKSAPYRLEAFTGGLGDDDGLLVIDPDAGPEDATVTYLEKARVRAELRNALADLESFEQKLAVELRYLDGLSVKQTAEAMRTTEGAVKALTLRAMENLRRNWRVRALVAA